MKVAIFVKTKRFQMIERERVIHHSCLFVSLLPQSAKPYSMCYFVVVLSSSSPLFPTCFPCQTAFKKTKQKKTPVKLERIHLFYSSLSLSASLTFEFWRSTTRAIKDKEEFGREQRGSECWDKFIVV